MKYNIQLNQGNAALGSGKSITVNEVLETVDEKVLAREITHHNGLIPVQVAEDVLENFCKAACELMAQGYAIVLRSGGDAAIRIYGDIHVKGGSINLERAKQLDPTVEDLTLENASALVQKAGVTVRARAEVEQKMTDMLLAEGASVVSKGVVEKAYVESKNGNGGGTDGGNQQGGGTDGGDEPEVEP